MIFIRRLLHPNSQIDKHTHTHTHIYICMCVCVCVVIYVLDLMYCVTSLIDEKNSSKAELEISGNWRFSTELGYWMVDTLFGETISGLHGYKYSSSLRPTYSLPWLRKLTTRQSTEAGKSTHSHASFNSNLRLNFGPNSSAQINYFLLNFRLNFLCVYRHTLHATRSTLLKIHDFIQLIIFTGHFLINLLKNANDDWLPPWKTGVNLWIVCG